MEREERRMKGQREKRGRVAAPGLIVHYDPALSLLFSLCLCTFKVKMWYKLGPR